MTNFFIRLRGENLGGIAGQIFPLINTMLSFRLKGGISRFFRRFFIPICVYFKLQLRKLQNFIHSSTYLIAYSPQFIPYKTGGLGFTLFFLRHRQFCKHELRIFLQVQGICLNSLNLHYL